MNVKLNVTIKGRTLCYCHNPVTNKLLILSNNCSIANLPNYLTDKILAPDSNKQDNELTTYQLLQMYKYIYGQPKIELLNSGIKQLCPINLNFCKCINVYMGNQK